MVPGRPSPKVVGDRVIEKYNVLRDDAYGNLGA